MSFLEQDSYTEPCGCVWQNGNRIKLCLRHKHKDVPIHNIPRHPNRREKVWC